MLGGSEGLCLKSMRGVGGGSWEGQLGTSAKGSACFEPGDLLWFWQSHRDCWIDGMMGRISMFDSSLDTHWKGRTGREGLHWKGRGPEKGPREA